MRHRFFKPAWIGITGLWIGAGAQAQSNVVYDAEGASSGLGGWPTLGKVARAQANLNFSDPAPNHSRFYRLTAPWVSAAISLSPT